MDYEKDGLFIDFVRFELYLARIMLWLTPNELEQGYNDDDDDDNENYVVIVFSIVMWWDFLLWMALDYACVYARVIMWLRFSNMVWLGFAIWVSYFYK